MRVIGLTGDARAGKNTVGGIIAEELEDQRVVLEGFSDRLKVSAAKALGFDGPDDELIRKMDDLKIDGHVEADALGFIEPVRITGRQYLQRFGTEAHRDVFSENFWVDAVLPLHQDHVEGLGPFLARDDADVLVLTDLRFENEAERVRAYGGEVWRIRRPGTEAGTHASEIGLPRYMIDRTIENDGSLYNLRGHVRRALLAARMGPVR